MCAALFGLMLVCSTIVLPPPCAAGRPILLGSQLGRISGPVQEQVDVTRARHFGPRHARRCSELRCDFLGDLPGRPPQFARQLHCQRQRQVAHLKARRLAQRRLRLRPVLPPHELLRGLLNLLLPIEVQTILSGENRSRKTLTIACRQVSTGYGRLSAHWRHWLRRLAFSVPHRAAAVIHLPHEPLGHHEAASQDSHRNCRIEQSFPHRLLLHKHIGCQTRGTSRALLPVKPAGLVSLWQD